jgi:ABC-2 type transport system permease protein
MIGLRNGPMKALSLNGNPILAFPRRYPLLFIPSLLMIYVDFNSLPIWLRAVLFAIPYSHPVLASRAVTMGDYWTAVWGTIYVYLFTLGIMYAASRLFATERILTAKLKFRGLGKRGKVQAEE